MGVPSFFRWLSYRYPSIITYAYEEKKNGDNGEIQPTNTSEPNPNGVEFDNLYLDMNGIIHPCCHPEEKLAPATLEDMFEEIFKYINRIFNIVRPRKLLYMAVDGVAPRAKMNQQRSRRFRSAIESIDNNKNMENLRKQLLDKGCKLAGKRSFDFDSNCITPGTEFMHHLSKKLDGFIKQKIENDPGWSNIQVIFSDANVPGEGEHKIMDFIRKQRNCAGYNPNTRHCLNGADADLIMLGLATHELHFTILREEFIPNRPKPCPFCEQYGHLKEDCSGIITDEFGNTILTNKPPPMVDIKFLFISLPVLREYLQRDLCFYPGELKFEYNFERCIDDWIFLCFFVGNDFLPHLPSLEIRENAIDRLVNLYKELLPYLDDYLTKNGFLNVENVQLLLKKLGYYEDGIFKERQNKKLQIELRLSQQEGRKRKFNNDDGKQIWKDDLAQKSYQNSSSYRSTYEYFKLESPHSIRQGQLSSFLVESSSSPNHLTTNSNKNAADILRQQLASEDDKCLDNTDSLLSTTSTDGVNTSAASKSLITDDTDIELHKEGWRSRYYLQKFGISESDPDYNDFRNNVVKHYVQGLSWVLQYYYQGCPSWSWYYPFHYAPFASDCYDIINTNVHFPKDTQPCTPFEQLLAVFPANSKQFLPISWQRLMEDSESEIIDFYPINFVVDLNGKKYSWQGVALLPFIDEERLLNAIKNNHLVDNLTPAEQERNSVKIDRIYFSSSHPIYNYLISLKFDNLSQSIELKPLLCDNTSGIVMLTENDIDLLQKSLINVIRLDYKQITYPTNYIFEPKVLSGSISPEPILKSLHESNNGKSYTPKLHLPNSISVIKNPYQLDRKASCNMLRHNTSRNYFSVGGPVSHYNPQLKYSTHTRNQPDTNYLRLNHYESYHPYDSKDKYVSRYNEISLPHPQGHYNPQYYSTNNQSQKYNTPPSQSYYNNDDNNYDYSHHNSYFAHKNRFFDRSKPSYNSHTSKNSKPMDPRHRRS